MDPVIVKEIRRLLEDAGISQYQLMQAGIGTQTARKLLGKAPGLPSLESADRALGLLGKHLWHRRSPASGT